jgi:radical SAM protein with 4Fe4S-binding SPASM domain
MLYRQKLDTFIRIFGGEYNSALGYINNKSVGDRVVDASGAMFISALSREGQSLDSLCEKIAIKFVGVSPADIRQDAADFFTTLEEDGFIVSGESLEELANKDTRFSYELLSDGQEFAAGLDSKIIKAGLPPSIRRTAADKDTQDYLDEHFKSSPYLMSLQIELTSSCNERCVHCYIPHENKVSYIEPALFYDIIDQCRDMGVLSLTFSGGEPLMHKNFCEFLRKAKEYDFSITILSNLTLLDDKIIEEMKANRLSSVQVSLYSMNPDIHDSITKLPGSFYKTRDNILRLIENDIPLQISCPTMKQNKDCFADVLHWAYDHKVRAVTDYIMMARYDHSKSNLVNRLDIGEVEKIISDIIENNPNYQRMLLSADFTENESRDQSEDPVCGVCINSICMISNGNIYPCAGWQDYVCGNIRETPLREIWEKSPKVQYLRGLRKKDFLKCISCADSGFCAMCMVRNANEDVEGNPLHINEHFCRVSALNRKIALEWREKMIQQNSML